MKRRGVCHSVYQGGVTGEHAAGPVPCANAIRVYIADMVVERIFLCIIKEENTNVVIVLR